ncbi:MAG: stage II sporulation protein R [Clostridia bacterium]|nr:stage II sporulation protein R [Clostridia bacterium]
MRFLKIFSVLIVLTVLLYLVSFAADDSVYNDVVRFHVIANSNSECDQKIKLEVRDMVIQKYSSKLSMYRSKETALAAAKEMLPDIEKDVNDFLSDYAGYTAAVSIEEEYFPTRTYGEYSLPRGNYTALCIRLGKSEGQNYWCVLFPPLCLGASSADDEKLFEDCGLGKEEYNLMRGEKPQYKLKFKLLEVFSK